MFTKLIYRGPSKTTKEEIDRKWIEQNRKEQKAFAKNRAKRKGKKKPGY